MLSSRHCFLQAWAAWFSILKSTYSHAFSVHLYYWILHHQAQSLSRLPECMAGMNDEMMLLYPKSNRSEKHMCPQTAKECINSPRTKELTLVHGLTDLYIQQPTACCKVLINQKRRMSLSILTEISRAHSLYYQQPTLLSHFLNCWIQAKQNKEKWA